MDLTLRSTLSSFKKFLIGLKKKNGNILTYLKFIGIFTLTPTTLITVWLMNYISFYPAYLISCIFTGTLLFKLKK